MDRNSIDAIALNATDSTGAIIDAVYQKLGRSFAVYRANDRIRVQFADAPEEQTEQRHIISRLNPLRGEINGLLAPWRCDDTRVIRRTRVDYYDQQTADALGAALLGDGDQGEILLRATRQQLLEERQSIGRAQYLLTAALCGIAVVALVGFLHLVVMMPGLEMFQDMLLKDRVFLSTALGSLGALFSIALAIRGREMNPQLTQRDNVIDATLRVLIGAVSALMLFSLIRSGLFSLTINGTTLAVGGKGTGSATGSIVDIAIIVAFIAGFAERMVGDYLSDLSKRFTTETVGTPLQAGLEVPNAPAKSFEAKVPASPPRVSVGAEKDSADSLGSLESNVTEDEDLPAATGGVQVS